MLFYIEEEVLLLGLRSNRLERRMTEQREGVLTLDTGRVSDTEARGITYTFRKLEFSLYRLREAEAGLAYRHFPDGKR